MPVSGDQLDQFMTELLHRLNESRDFDDGDVMMLIMWCYRFKVVEAEARVNAASAARHTAMRFRSQAGGKKGRRNVRADANSSHDLITQHAHELLAQGKKPHELTSLLENWARRKTISPASKPAVRKILKNAGILKKGK